MNWLSLHWDLALTIGLLALSEIMPALPTKANGIISALINIGKLVLGAKGKPVPVLKVLPGDNNEPPKVK